MDTQHLDDEALAATAFVWHERARLGDRQARQIADELDAELRHRLGPTPSEPAPLLSVEPTKLARPSRRTWWQRMLTRIRPGVEDSSDRHTASDG